VFRVICIARDSFFWNEMESFRERVAIMATLGRLRGDDGRGCIVRGDVAGDVLENFLPCRADL